MLEATQIVPASIFSAILI